VVVVVVDAGVPAPDPADGAATDSDGLPHPSPMPSHSPASTVARHRRQPSVPHPYLPPPQQPAAAPRLLVAAAGAAPRLWLRLRQAGQSAPAGA